MITIVLPVYNGANYLGSSLASVLAQNTDFTLHVLDDGSTDASADIARSTGDSRVHYSRNPVKFGLFKTLNRGFAEATTPLVRIWAHDDVMLAGSLQRFVEFAERQPAAGMIYCDFWTIDPQGNRTGQERQYGSQRARTPELANSALSALLFYAFGCLPGNISTVLLRREIWQRSGGFLEGIQQAPDYDMWVRISGFTGIGFLREKVIELRDHPLQLAKLGAKQMTTIVEELPIFRTLVERLSPLAPQDVLLRFWAQHRGRQYMHWIVRALLRRDFESARRGWAALGAYGSRGTQALTWLLSANGRFLTTKCDDFFDTLLKRNCF